MKVSTGSTVFDELLWGGLPPCCVMDIFGASATGKTQLAFQTALMMSLDSTKATLSTGKPPVIFVDCMGSFRPERIEEIARSRNQGYNIDQILNSIYATKARTISGQMESNNILLREERFSSVRLLIVDDVTSNFVSEISGSAEAIIERQSILTVYARQLALIAFIKNLSVFITNSVRSTMNGGENETTGEIFSSHCLFQIHLEKVGNDRIAKLIQPPGSRKRLNFTIERQGIP